jgi:capsular exopolysaccharide synthesis family protein
MSIRNYISIIGRRIWVIVVTFVATMVIVVVGTRFLTPIYQASTTLRIATSSLTQTNYQDYQYSDRLMNTYIEISASESVKTELMKRLNLAKAPDIKSEILPNTELIKITLEDPNPIMAANEANTLADILIAQSSQLYTGGGLSSAKVMGDQLAQANQKLSQMQLDYQKLLVETPPSPDKIEVARQALTLQQNTYSTLLYQYDQATITAAMRASMVTVVDRALPAENPTRPKKLINYALGLILGLAGGLGLAFLFENLDTTVHTVEEIESITKLEPLAKISKANRRQIDISRDYKSTFAGAFLNLATKIQLIDHQQTRKIILIMSPESRQGKSTIVTNLAYALAESGKKVVAIDCDLHLPQLHRLFRLPNVSGLTDILNRNASLASCLQKSPYNNANVLTSGSLPDYPSKMLSSSKMVDLIEKLKQKFDYILLDAPALLPFADTEILAQYADGVIMVVRQGFAKRKAIQTGQRFLALYPDKIIGCIVNHTKDVSDYGYYDLHHRSYPSVRTQRPRSLGMFKQDEIQKPKSESIVDERNLG